MQQQVEVTVKLSLEVNAEKSKEQIKQMVETKIHQELHLNFSDYLSLEVINVREEAEIYDIEPDITYYLFGHEAVRNYQNGDMEAVKTAVEWGDGAVYEHNENDASSLLVEAMDGWSESDTITKEEFKKFGGAE